MSIITKIEEQKNKKRVNIFVDDAFFCGLLKETAIKFGLKIGKNVDEATLKQMVKDSEITSAFNISLDYLSNRLHTKNELLNKLIKKGFEKQVSIEAIEKLEEYHYIDDELFARQFFLQNTKLSKKMIENKLKQKGISSQIISVVLYEQEDDKEFEICKNSVSKYLKTKDMSKENSMQKLIASLARKGFEFGMIKKAIKEITSIDSDFDSYD